MPHTIFWTDGNETYRDNFKTEGEARAFQDEKCNRGYDANYSFIPTGL